MRVDGPSESVPAGKSDEKSIAVRKYHDIMMTQLSVLNIPLQK